MTGAPSTQMLVFAGIAVFAVWRRFRRNIGRQPFKEGVLRGRVVIFALIAVLCFAAVGRSVPMLESYVGGLVLGLALAWFGLSLTRFESTAEGRFYTPNMHLGLALSLLFVGRLAYRMMVFADASARPARPLGQSPLTWFIAALLFGYYAAYYGGVLTRARKLAAPVAPVP